MKRTIALGSALALGILSLGACSKKEAKGSGSGSGKAAAFAQENKPANLKALLRAIQKAQQGDDVDRAAGLTRGLLPSEARLQKALKPGVPKDVVGKMMAMHQMFSGWPKRKLARLLGSKPGQTEIQVHGATTEEIAANKPGSIVFKEFPGGAVKLAQALLRPGVTFYEVEFLEPGKERGMKYHLFYWDGKRWAMLGPMWRALR